MLLKFRIQVFLISSIFSDFAKGWGGRKCVVTECKPLDEMPCAPGYKMIYPMKFMCPAMHLSRYKCCPLMNVVAPVGSFDDKMEGQLEEYGDKPVERVCKLTKCKSSITKEAKCSHGALEYGIVEGECGPKKAQFRCCHFPGHGEGERESELELDEEMAEDDYGGEGECATTECGHRCPEGKVIHKTLNCAGGKLKYNCCNLGFSEHVIQPIADDEEGFVDGFRTGPFPDMYESAHESCITTECKSTLTKESKCDEGQVQLWVDGDQCEKDHAQYRCCVIPQGELGEKEWGTCTTTECQHHDPNGRNCPKGHVLQWMDPQHCEQNKAKHRCCSLGLGPHKGGEHKGDEGAAEEGSEPIESEVDHEKIPEDFRKGQFPAIFESAHEKCVTTDCKSSTTKEKKCDDGQVQKWMDPDQCDPDMAQYRCCTENDEAKKEWGSCTVTECKKPHEDGRNCPENEVVHWMKEEECENGEAKYNCCKLPHPASHAKGRSFSKSKAKGRSLLSGLYHGIGNVAKGIFGSGHQSGSGSFESEEYRGRRGRYRPGSASYES